MRNTIKKLAAIILLLSLSFLSLIIGTKELSLHELFLSDHDQWFILIQTRIPRTISLVFAGAMISIGGRVLQHLMQNRFVSANTIGMMDSARLGMLIVMLCLPNASIFMRTGVAFLFSYAGVLLFLGLSRFLPRGNPLILPLTGIMFGNVIGAIASFFAYQYQLVQNIISWLQGNFSMVIKGQYELIYLTIPVLLAVYFLGYQITVAGLGEEAATAFGLSYQRLLWIVLALVALGNTSVLLLVGSVPFLGIVVPNLVALYFGDHVKHTMWITAVCGSNLLIVCDLIARLVIAPYELPVSVVVGLVCGTLFLFLLFKKGVRS